MSISKHWGDVYLRPGLKLDYNSYMGRFTLAPRLSSSYVFPWKSTNITLGANRYYGRSFYNYGLSIGRESMQVDLERKDEATRWEKATRKPKASMNRFEFMSMRVPYSDEFTAGIGQRLFSISADLKYIHRRYKDGIRKARACSPIGKPSVIELACPPNKCNSTSSSSQTATHTCRNIYSNEGRSTADVISFALRNDKPLEALGTGNYFMLSMDRTVVKRNYEDYDSAVQTKDTEDTWVSWNGVLTHWRERPATNFARPYTAKLSTSTVLNVYRTKWTWSNYLNYRSNYMIMASSSEKHKFKIKGVEKKVDTYLPYKVPGSVTWDMRVGLEVKLRRNHAVFVNLDIMNVSNTRAIATARVSHKSAPVKPAATKPATTKPAASSTPSSPASKPGINTLPTYEVGRQYWIEIGYRF